MFDHRYLQGHSYSSEVEENLEELPWGTRKWQFNGQNLCMSVGNCSMICRWPPSHQTGGCSKSSMPPRQLTTAGMQLTALIDCFACLPLIWSRIRVQFVLPCMHFLSPLWSQEYSLLITIESARWHCGLVYHLLCIMAAYHFIVLLKA